MSLKNWIRHIPASQLHVSKSVGWLESRFHFSFAEYYNPDNVNFGVLRVLNDDLVKPRSGFGTHSHRNAEIFTYVLQGKLTHKDSMGTEETLGRGSVQYMSAGSGVSHSEMNNSSEMLRFLQIWITPCLQGVKPNYGSRTFDKEARHNKLLHVLTGYGEDLQTKDSKEGLIYIHQDANIYVSETDPGIELEFEIKRGRQIYLVCAEGGLEVNQDVVLQTKDALEVKASKSDMKVNLKSQDGAGSHFLVIEMELS